MKKVTELNVVISLVSSSSVRLLHNLASMRCLKIYPLAKNDTNALNIGCSNSFGQLVHGKEFIKYVMWLRPRAHRATSVSSPPMRIPKSKVTEVSVKMLFRHLCVCNKKTWNEQLWRYQGRKPA